MKRSSNIKIFFSKRNLDKVFGGGIIERNTFMADITKCPGWDCTQKDKCYRYLAISGMRQSFFTECHYNKEKGNCPYFWGTQGR